MDISNLGIKRIPKKFQERFKCLKSLNISNNPEFDVSCLNYDFFSKIEDLIAENCNLTNMNANLFFYFPSLKLLNLSGNTNIKISQLNLTNKKRIILEDISLRDCKLTHNDIKLINSLKKLKNLDVSHNEGLIFEMFLNTNLEKLNLDECHGNNYFVNCPRISNKSEFDQTNMPQINQSLKILYISGKEISYSMCSYLQSCSKLKVLSLNHFKNINFQNLNTVFERLANLIINNCYNISDYKTGPGDEVHRIFELGDFFIFICEFCNNLTVLDIKNVDLSSLHIGVDCIKFKDKLEFLSLFNCSLGSHHIPFINSFTRLKFLNISYNPFDENSFIYFRNKIIFRSTIKNLNISGCGDISDWILSALNNCKLHTLVANDACINNTVLQNVMFLDKFSDCLNFNNVKDSLKILRLNNCGINNLEMLLTAISCCKKLQFLDLSNNKFSDKVKINVYDRKLELKNNTASIENTKYYYDFQNLRIYDKGYKRAHDDDKIVTYSEDYIINNVNVVYPDSYNRLFLLGKAFFMINNMRNSLKEFYLKNVIFDNNLRILFENNFENSVVLDY